MVKLWLRPLKSKKSFLNNMTKTTTKTIEIIKAEALNEFESKFSTILEYDPEIRGLGDEIVEFFSLQIEKAFEAGKRESAEGFDKEYGQVY